MWFHSMLVIVCAYYNIVSALNSTIIIETRQAEDLSGPSNIYILISEEQQHEM